MILATPMESSTPQPSDEAADPVPVRFRGSERLVGITSSSVTESTNMAPSMSAAVPPAVDLQRRMNGLRSAAVHGGTFAHSGYRMVACK